MKNSKLRKINSNCDGLDEIASICTFNANPFNTGLFDDKCAVFRIVDKEDSYDVLPDSIYLISERWRFEESSKFKCRDEF